jgi:tRNA(Ile2) C34 agmatinyltransferase TiaS
MVWVGVYYESIKVEPRTNPLLSLLVTQEEHEVNQVHKGLHTVGVSYKSIKVEPRTNPLLSLLVTQEEHEVNQVHKGLRTVVEEVVAEEVVVEEVVPPSSLSFVVLPDLA